MKVLLACEESQAVCMEFRKKGHIAYSCDLQDCSGDHPEWHIKGDCLDELNKDYDLKISFPPCTDLATSGARWFDKKRLDGSQEKSITFFLNVWRKSHCTENPMGIMNGGEYVKKWFPKLYKYAQFMGFPFKSTQTINPYYFGDEFQKKTCLWLRGLPKLQHFKMVDLFNSNITHVPKGEIHITKSGKKMAKWYSLLASNDQRGKIRSKTFPGIAKAMAEQWG